MRKLATILTLTVIGFLTLSVATRPRIEPQPFIAFDHNSLDIDTCNDSSFATVMSFFKEYPSGQLEIRGFAGQNEKTTISFERATAVRDYLVDKGLRHDQFKLTDKGIENAPLDKELQLYYETNKLRIEAINNNRVVTFLILTMDEIKKE